MRKLPPLEKPNIDASWERRSLWVVKVNTRRDHSAAKIAGHCRNVPAGGF